MVRRRRGRHRLRTFEKPSPPGRRGWRRRRRWVGADGHGHDRAIEPEPPVSFPARRRRTRQVGGGRCRRRGHERWQAARESAAVGRRARPEERRRARSALRRRVLDVPGRRADGSGQRRGEALRGFTLRTPPKAARGCGHVGRQGQRPGRATSPHRIVRR